MSMYYSVSDSVNIPESLMQSQTDLQPPGVQKKDITDYISSEIRANVEYSSDVSFIMACCKRLDREERS